MFGKFFNMDNVFWRTMNIVADIFILNILFILFSLPIITIGPSITAMYTITLKMVKNEESYIIRGFWDAFKRNFKQSTIIWLIMLVSGAFIGFDIYLAYCSESSFVNIMFYIFLAIAFIYIMIFSFIFPLESKFDNPISSSFKNALLMGIVHMFPWTLIIIVLNSLSMLLFVFLTDIFFTYIFPIMLLCGFSSIAYFNSIYFNKIFDCYIPKEKEEEKETATDLDSEEIENLKITLTENDFSKENK